LILLGADTSADARQSIIGFYQPPSANRATSLDKLDELWNFYSNRAAFHAKRSAALQAPFSFDQGLLGRESKRHFLEVAPAFMGGHLGTDLACFCGLRRLGEGPAASGGWGPGIPARW